MSFLIAKKYISLFHIPSLAHLPTQAMKMQERDVGSHEGFSKKEVDWKQGHDPSWYRNGLKGLLSWQNNLCMIAISWQIFYFIFCPHRCLRFGSYWKCHLLKFEKRSLLNCISVVFSYPMILKMIRKGSWGKLN